MSEAFLVYPRLRRDAARQLIEELGDLSPQEQRDRADTSHPLAGPVPTGGTPAPWQRIKSVQDAVRGLADDHGWPEPNRTGSVANRSFDIAAGEVFLEKMQIIPSDAAAEGVWSFTALVVLPDVAFWRFPSGNEDRLVGRPPRHVFRRLWWQQYVLEGANAEDLPGRPLGEDELVGIFERPSLAQHPVLARAMVSAVRDINAGPRSEIARDLAKRVLRTAAVINVAALDGPEVNELVADLCAVSTRVVTG